MHVNRRRTAGRLGRRHDLETRNYVREPIYHAMASLRLSTQVQVVRRNEPFMLDLLRMDQREISGHGRPQTD